MTRFEAYEAATAVLGKDAALWTFHVNGAPVYVIGLWRSTGELDPERLVVLRGGARAVEVRAISASSWADAVARLPMPTTPAPSTSYDLRPPVEERPFGGYFDHVAKGPIERGPGLFLDDDPGERDDHR